MKIKDLDRLRVIVSEEEWKKISPELKIEMIALSRMTGEDISNNLNEDEEILYNDLMEI